MQCCLITCTMLSPWGSRQHYKRKILFIVVLISLEQHCIGQNPMQCCLTGKKQHSEKKKKKSCVMLPNTLGTILHRKNLQNCPRAPDNITQEKILCNVVWTPSCHFTMIFILDRLFFLIIYGCCKCPINIVQI